MIKAVLFDMDGTITDTEKYYCRAWERAFHEFGFADFTFADALSQRSLNSRDAKIRWESHYSGRLDYGQVRALANRYVEDMIRENGGVPLKPGIDEALSFLRDRKVKTAVVTATEYGRASRRLKELGLFDRFDTVISAHMVENGKPFPDPYIYACEQIGEKPSDCIALEDAPNGVLSAYRAGCVTVMVPDLTEPDGKLSRMIAARLDSLRDIGRLFENE